MRSTSSMSPSYTLRISSAHSGLAVSSSNERTGLMCSSSRNFV